MAHTLTDGERETLAELQEWSAADRGDGPDLSGDWCRRCDNPVEECRCRPIAASRPAPVMDVRLLEPARTSKRAPLWA